MIFSCAGRINWMEKRSVADVEGPWFDPNFESSLRSQFLNHQVVVYREQICDPSYGENFSGAD